MADDLPITDRQLLGQRGVELCSGVPVFSAYSLDANHGHHNSMLLYTLFVFYSTACPWINV